MESKGKACGIFAVFTVCFFVVQLTRYHLAALAAFLIWGFFPIPLRMLASYSSGQILFFGSSFPS